MRPYFASVLFATLIIAPKGASAVSVAKAQVMVLGVSHLVSRHDIHNSVFQDDPLSAKRQAQSADVVHRLLQFHPTKVLIEAQMNDPKVKQQYVRYLSGDFVLGPNEIYQFGFRLAKLAGNREIYPIDTFGPNLLNDDPTIDAYLKANVLRVQDAPSTVFVARGDSLERSGTYLDLLRYLNSDDAIRANASFYSVLDGMGRSAHSAGSAYVSQWYARNCYIFANILSVVRPGDRVIVIMGQGHEYLLREFVRLNPNLLDVNPLTYLSRPAGA